MGRIQKIIKEGTKDYLVVSLPTTADFFEYGFVSSTGKSFVFRRWDYAGTSLLDYQHFRLNDFLLKGRRIISRNHFHKNDIFTHDFNGIGLPSIKIAVTSLSVA